MKKEKIQEGAAYTPRKELRGLNAPWKTQTRENFLGGEGFTFAKWKKGHMGGRYGTPIWGGSMGNPVRRKGTFRKEKENRFHSQERGRGRIYPPTGQGPENSAKQRLFGRGEFAWLFRKKLKEKNKTWGGGKLKKEDRRRRKRGKSSFCCSKGIARKMFFLGYARRVKGLLPEGGGTFLSAKEKGEGLTVGEKGGLFQKEKK